jgi:hypothetical protein
LYQTNYSNNFPVAITGTIIAGNMAGSQNANLQLDPQSAWTVNYDLIGSTTGSGITAFTGIGNLLNVNPALGLLADHGGPTKTHALLPGSPALDAGDPMTDDAVPFDQRGMPYGRVADGDSTPGARIDIGAYEAQGVPEAMPGDYNRNGVADAADYTVWRNALGATGLVPLTGADGDGDGKVSQIDYRVWKSHFGQVFPLPGAGSGASYTTALTVEPAAAREAGPMAPATQLGRSGRWHSLNAALEARVQSHDSGIRPHRQVRRLLEATHGSKHLLLLAIDRVERSARSSVPTTLDRESYDADVDDHDDQAHVDNPLAGALAAWQ